MRFSGSSLYRNDGRSQEAIEPLNAPPRTTRSPGPPGQLPTTQTIDGILALTSFEEVSHAPRMPGLPVVIDSTAEAHARVPEKFLSVQWLKLPGGRPSPALVFRARL